MSLLVKPATLYYRSPSTIYISYNIYFRVRVNLPDLSENFKRAARSSTLTISFGVLINLNYQDLNLYFLMSRLTLLLLLKS